MYQIKPERVGAVERALALIGNTGDLSEKMIAQVTGLPVSEVRAALNAIADRRRWARRAQRMRLDADDGIGVFLMQYQSKFFPFI
jgi:hypothetical protein